MAYDVRIERGSARAFPATGTCRVGAAEVEITPNLGIAMAGYSTDGKRAKEVESPLFARAFAFEDAAGARAAICVADLMTATRYLLEKTASLTAPTCGISVDRLIFVGTHTHTGPGHVFGNATYDHLAQCQSGFDEGLANWLSERCASAIDEAFERLQSGGIASVDTNLWGVSRNASPRAFDNNPECDQWHEPGWPGAGVPEGLTPAQRAIDPRIKTLALVGQSGDLVAILSSFACHNTALGSPGKAYSADWIGVAGEVVRSELGDAESGPPPIVGFAPGPGGDINTLSEQVPQGRELVRHVGTEVGKAVGSAIKTSSFEPQPFDLAISCREVAFTERIVSDQADTELSDQWCFGVPSLAGGEESRTVLYKLGIAKPGHISKHFPEDDPQFPKARALGPLQGLYRRMKGLDVSPIWALHALRLGPFLWVTLPGEPTIVTGHRIERELLSCVDGLERVTVLGYSGDYTGYITTEEEYRTQHYEGASVLFGRNQARWFQAHIKELATSEPTPVAEEAVPFSTVKPISRFTGPNE